MSGLESFTGATTTVVGTPACGYCGGYHSTTCPRVSRIEYGDNGLIRAVDLRPLEVEPEVKRYPYEEGDVTVIGPECFIGRGEGHFDVISYQGENFVPWAELDMRDGAFDTLVAIAKVDYRGNPSHEITMAQTALRDMCRCEPYRGAENPMEHHQGCPLRGQDTCIPRKRATG